MYSTELTGQQNHLSRESLVNVEINLDQEVWQYLGGIPKHDDPSCDLLRALALHPTQWS